MDKEVIFDTEQELLSETFFSMGDLQSKFNQISIRKDKDEVLFGIGNGRTTINQHIKAEENGNKTENNWFEHHPFYAKVNIHKQIIV